MKTIVNFYRNYIRNHEICMETIFQGYAYTFFCEGANNISTEFIANFYSVHYYLYYCAFCTRIMTTFYYSTTSKVLSYYNIIL